MFMPDNTVYRPVDDPNLSAERTPNRRLPVDQRLNSMEEIESVYTEEQALAEAARCLGCPTHWCQKACPALMPVPDFIARIREKDYEGAYSIIRSASTLPEMCSRLCPQEKQCQSNCTRSIRGMAVGIGRLERFVTEQHYAAAGTAAPAAPSGKHVAVVGSGPSGLSAAQELVDLGHTVTVFEQSHMVGGLLTYGIPGTKLDKDVVERKAQALQAQGVEFRTAIVVGKELSVSDLSAHFDAAILAVGTANARKLTIAGAENAQGIVPAVDFLSSATDSDLTGAANPNSAKGLDVIIVGGGDTGSDCVGVSLRGGCRSLTQIEMLPKVTGRTYMHSPFPAPVKEVKKDTSMEECMAVFGKDPHVYQTTVKSVTTDADGRLASVTTVALEPVYDEHFRLTMKEIPGSEQELPCQLLVIAAGFIGPDANLTEALGVETAPNTAIACRDYMTSVPGLFACGDCRTGQSLVVKAMVDGRKCAQVADAYLRG